MISFQELKSLTNNLTDFSKINYLQINPIIISHLPQEHKNQWFISKAKKVHGNRYNYSNVIYINKVTKVTIICPEHGIFEQRAEDHWNGKGCNKCNKFSKKSLQQFLSEANQVHNNKYDYSLITDLNYKGVKQKYQIICPEHGIFEQKAENHLNGQECVQCAKIKNDNLSRKTTEQFIKEANKVHNNKYSYSQVVYINTNEKVTIICPEHGIFEQKPVDHINRKQGCPNCAGNKRKSTKQFVGEANKVHNNKYNYLKTSYSNKDEKVEIICETHGSFLQTPKNHLAGQGCPKCANSGFSKGEKDLLDYISSVYTGTVIENKKFDNKYEIDIYLPDLGIGFEYNGIYHHSFNNPNNNKSKSYHLQKSKFFHEKNISLIHIWEDNWLNKQDLVKSMINHKLDLSEKIYARKCKVISVSSQVAKSFFDENHIHGGLPSKINLGLILNKELVSVLSFSTHPEYGWEINRYATQKGRVAIGGFSKLLKSFIRFYKPKTIYTYQDRDWGYNPKASVYHVNGFSYIGSTDASYWYVDKDMNRVSRQKMQKHKLLEMFPHQNPNKSETEICFDEKYYGCANSGNNKYLLKVIN